MDVFPSVKDNISFGDRSKTFFSFISILALHIVAEQLEANFKKKTIAPPPENEMIAA